MKIPFSIKYRPQIESGEYKVETRDHIPVTILEWDKYIHGMRHRILGDFNDKIDFWDINGRYNDVAHDCCLDLFIVTPEQELSEFEKAVGLEIFDEPFEERHIKVIKEESAKLLVLAREQIIKDGYVIEKKAFHDAVEKIDDKNKAEMSIQYSLNCIVENGTRHAVMNWKSFQKLAQHFIDIGKAEALKDLPRWRKWGNGACGNGQGIPLAIVKRGLNGYELVDALGIQGEQYIILSDLEKLPGFNEDEK